MLIADVSLLAVLREIDALITAEERKADKFGATDRYRQDEVAGTKRIKQKSDGQPP